MTIMKAKILILAAAGVVAWLALRHRGGEPVGPGIVQPTAPPEPAGRAVPVERREIEEMMEWPGTVQSRTVAQVASKVLAQVREVRVKAGDRVKTGDILAILDDRDLKSRADQARSAVAAAEAQSAQAAAEFARATQLLEKQAITQSDFDAAKARTRALEALLAQARDALREAEIAKGEATVRAPFDGVVEARSAEPGDLATPGRALATIHDPARLRLEARVPETCALRAAPGREVIARIDALGSDLPARVDEVVPAADPVSRSVLVKASLPEAKGLRPGMFGRFLQPCGKRAALLVPAAAVARVGQLESARVRERGGAWTDRQVRTGRAFGDRLEVLSGLKEGEEVLVPPAPK